MKIFISVIFIIALIALIVFFAALNSNVVTVNFYLWHLSLPLPLMMLVILFIGCILGIAVCLPVLWRNHQALNESQKLLATAEQEINNLRKLPLKGM